MVKDRKSVETPKTGERVLDLLRGSGELLMKQVHSNDARYFNANLARNPFRNWASTDIDA